MADERRESGMEVEMENIQLRRKTAQERKSLVQEHGHHKSGIFSSTLSFASQVPLAYLRRKDARILYLSFKWQITVSIIVVLDVIFLIAELHWESKISGLANTKLTAAQRHELAGERTWHKFFQVWSVVVTGVYITDITMRMRAFGHHKFFRRPLNILDLIITVITTINNIVLIILENRSTNSTEEGDVVEDIAILRLFRTARFLRMILSLRQVAACRCLTSARYAVTGNRRRYVDIEQDFDLDISYITPRVIAMSVPAEGWMHWWNRNDLHEVVRFFETHHRGKYMIFNCCPEMPYPDSAFTSGDIVKFDIQDHTPPTMDQFIEFLTNACDWNRGVTEHVMAVHCKGGKGRTGSLIVGWLMYNRDCISLEDALNNFALCRTDLTAAGALQTVETPSQVRYLGQLEHLLKAQNAYVPREILRIRAPRVVLTSVCISNVFKKKPPERMVVAIHRFSSGTDVEVVYWSKSFNISPASSMIDSDIFLNDTEISGDMRISVFDEKKLQSAREKSGGPAFRGDLCKAAEEDQSLTGKRAKIYIAGKEPGCLFYFLLHSAFLQNTGEGVAIGENSGGFRVSIGPSEKSPGMCQAWKKPSKYNREGQVVLKYKDLEKIELTEGCDQEKVERIDTGGMNKW